MFVYCTPTGTSTTTSSGKHKVLQVVPVQYPSTGIRNLYTSTVIGFTCVHVRPPMPNSELKSQSILLKIKLFGYGNSYLSPDTYTLMSRRQEKVNAIRRPEVGGGWRIQVGAQIGYSTQGLFLPYILIFSPIVRFRVGVSVLFIQLQYDRTSRLLRTSMCHITHSSTSNAIISV